MAKICGRPYLFTGQWSSYCIDMPVAKVATFTERRLVVACQKNGVGAWTFNFEEFSRVLFIIHYPGESIISLASTLTATNLLAHGEAGPETRIHLGTSTSPLGRLPHRTVNAAAGTQVARALFSICLRNHYASRLGGCSRQYLFLSAKLVRQEATGEYLCPL